MGLLGENGIEFVPFDPKLQFLAMLDHFGAFIVFFSPSTVVLKPLFIVHNDFGSILYLGQDNSL